MTGLAVLRRAQPVTLSGASEAAKERAVQMDRALRALMAPFDGEPSSLFAVGGYGRTRLSPHSDVDLLIVTTSRSSSEVVRAVIYPLWDAGWQVGYAVRSPKDAIAFADKDLAAATSLLTIRVVAGDQSVTRDFEGRVASWQRRAAPTLVARIVAGLAERHRACDRAGWVLAPDLKDDIGGLRDIHATGWLRRLRDLPAGDLAAAEATFLNVREALHATGPRKNDVLQMELQRAVAESLGIGGEAPEDELMRAVHTTAREVERAIETELADVRSSTGRPRRSGDVRALGERIRLEDGVVKDTGSAPGLATGLRLLEAVAATGKRLHPSALSLCRTSFAGEPSWDAPARAAFLGLLAAPHRIDALELGDGMGAWDRCLPGWSHIRGRAQHDPYHRYTVDAHLFMAVQEAAQELADRDPRALSDGDRSTVLLAALLHDVGKGSGRDHSEAGAEIAAAVCGAAGFPPHVARDVEALVRHHLLLIDTATRRDIEDPDVIARISGAIGDPRVLEMLHVLTVADARATGPGAWTPWKAALVTALVVSTRRALAVVEDVPAPTPRRPTEASVDVTFSADPGDPLHRSITVALADRPGALARSAGVLALHRISVLQARADSEGGRARQTFVMASAATDDAALAADLRAAHSGRLAVEPRVRRKAAEYAPARAPRVELRFVGGASSHSTLLEVRSPDVLGLLYAVTSAVAELGLDIHVAKIDTLGERVVDSFYIRSPAGADLDDGQMEALGAAISHRCETLLGASCAPTHR